jgi:hypothetical protein
MRAATLVVLALLISACTPRPEDHSPAQTQKDPRQSDASREYYVLPVDSVMVTPGLVRVTGPLGDGCQRFAYIDSVKQGSSLVLTLWASRPKAKDVACTMIMQYYDKSVNLPMGSYSKVIVKSSEVEIERPL